MYNLIATTTFGLEAICAKELKELGYDELKVSNGRVEFVGEEIDIAIANVHLRTADRILINMGEFKAVTFEELFQGVKSIKWEDIISEDGFMHVNGKSVKSVLHSVPDCQSITKKAVIEAMKRKYNTNQFKEDGPHYKIEVGILKDIVTMTIDTTGNGLHKRGYRMNSGAAPLKETLASAIVLLSGWKSNTPLLDPFCGSGTILIEAAMIAQNIAPGMDRNFTFETWDIIDKEEVDFVKENAKRSVKKNKDLKLNGYDKDAWVINTAKANAKKAGVFDNIYFRQRDVRDFSSGYEKALILTNPPYGERLEEAKEVEELSKILGSIRKANPLWEFGVFTAQNNFEKYFGEKSSKNRKLYNGRLLCYLYQYIAKKEN